MTAATQALAAIGTPDRTNWDWVVTARHRRPSHTGERAPWGERHLLRNGMSTSACGQPTAHWIKFWELTFDATHGDACPACVAAISGGGRRVERPAGL